MKGQVIIVNGTSGSGKSTTCELFARRSEDFWLLYGIDHFLSSTFPMKFGHHGPRSAEGIQAVPLDDKDPEGPLRWRFSELGMRGFQVMHEWVAAASRQGCNIILDHIMLVDPPVLQDCIWRLQDAPVLFVNLKPPYEVLLERIVNRSMDKQLPGSQYKADDMAQRVRNRLDRLRPWFYQAAYSNDCYDIEIDTDQHAPDAVCDLIERRLGEGPGEAFEMLRARHPGNTTEV